MTKKSVKDEIPRRSRTTMSSAFLSSANLAQRRANSSAPIDFSPIKLSLLDIVQDLLRNQIRAWQIVGNPVSHFGGRLVKSPPNHGIVQRQRQVGPDQNGEFHQLVQLRKLIPFW